MSRSDNLVSKGNFSRPNQIDSILVGFSCLGEKMAELKRTRNRGIFYLRSYRLICGRLLPWHNSTSGIHKLEFFSIFVLTSKAYFKLCGLCYWWQALGCLSFAPIRAVLFSCSSHLENVSKRIKRKVSQNRHRMNQPSSPYPSPSPRKRFAPVPLRPILPHPTPRRVWVNWSVTFLITLTEVMPQSSGAG